MKGKFHIKNYVRWICITAVVMVVIGCAVAFTGYAAGGFKLNALVGLDETTYATKTVEGKSSSIDTIVVDTDAADIRLSYSDTSDYVLEYPENRYSCKTDGGQIKIEGSSAERNRPWYQAFFFNNSFDERVILKVPQNFSGMVELNSDFGQIRITDDFTFDGLNIRSDNGAIRTGRLTVNGDAAIRSNFGSIDMEALTVSGDVQIKNDNGKISVKEMTGFGAADIRSNFGSTELSNIEGGSLAVQNDNGEVNLRGVSLKSRLSVNSNFGSIKCDRVFAPDIYLQSDNGSIKGTIEGNENDFDILYQAEVGSGSYSARGNGKYAIEAKSNFGSIDLDFSGR